MTQSLWQPLGEALDRFLFWPLWLVKWIVVYL